MSYDASTTIDADTREAIDIDRTKGDFHFPERHKFDAGRGLTERTVDYISDVKGEPQWIRDFRQKALKVFREKPMPTLALRITTMMAESTHSPVAAEVAAANTSSSSSGLLSWLHSTFQADSARCWWISLGP